MSHRFDLSGLIATAFAGVGVAASLIDIAAIAAVQAFNSSLSTAFTAFSG